jgi:hypothetical protein
VEGRSIYKTITPVPFLAFTPNSQVKLNKIITQFMMKFIIFIFLLFLQQQSVVNCAAANQKPEDNPNDLEECGISSYDPDLQQQMNVMNLFFEFWRIKLFKIPFLI